jgi:hypothetical protein
MYRIISFLLIIIDILAILDVWKRESTIERRLLWTILIIILPGLGALAWYAISRKIIKL